MTAKKQTPAARRAKVGRRIARSTPPPEKPLRHRTARRNADRRRAARAKMIADRAARKAAV